MNNWKELHIGNEVNILSGYPFDSKKFNTDKEGKPLIRIRDILESSISTYFSGSYPDTFLIKKGDILVGMDGDFHVAKWNNIDALLNQRILKVHQKKDAKIDIDYFYYFLQPFLKKVHEITAATTVKHLSTFDIIRAKKRFPEVKHQQKIAKFLNTIDAVIEKTEHAITKYQAIKKGMMHDLFTRGIDVKTGQLRPSFDDAPELYKESELGMIPRDWEDTFLGKYIVKNIYGPRFNANDYSKNGNVKTIRGTDFSKNGDILYAQCPIAQLHENTVNTHTLKKGDVVIVTTADCGLTAVFEEQDFKYIPSAYTVKYRFKDNIDPYYVKYYMNTNNAKRQVEQYIRKGTIANLPGSDLFKFIFNLPSPKEQKAIVQRLFQVEKLIKKEQKILAKHQNIKKGLMQDLLTGKVEAKV